MLALTSWDHSCLNILMLELEYELLYSDSIFSSVCLILICPTGQNLELLCSVDIHLPVISANNIISHTIHKMWLLNIDCDKTRRPRGSWHPWLLSCTVLICHHKVLGTLLWKSTQNQITSCPGHCLGFWISVLQPIFPNNREKIHPTVAAGSSTHL